MDIEQMERQLREQLEEHVGRSLTDHEWETFKRQVQNANSGSSRAVQAWKWTRAKRAACVGALLAAVAGVGLLLGWHGMFSPFVKAPLGVFALLLVPIGALMVLAMFVNAFRRGSGMDWMERLFAIFVFPFVSAPLLVALTAGGFALIVAGREYLTTTHSDWQTSPAQLVGWAFIIAGFLLAISGLPSRANNR